MTDASPRPENTAAVIVTRDPPADFGGRARDLGRQVDRVLVVDNGSSGPAAELLETLEEEPAVRVESLGENRGVAAALNRGIDRALEAGWEWALLLDQDSRPGGRLLKGLRAAYEACPFRDRVAVIGANYRNPDTGRLDRPPEEDPWTERRTVITAGSLLRLAAAREIGRFREDFFVDQVDHEYCLRARRAGWRVIAATAPLLEQPVGEASARPVPWGEVVTSGHPPERRYYMVRNHLLLAREYLRDEPAWVLRSLLARAAMVGRMLLLEGDRAAKLRAVLRGARDGLRGRSGRAPPELRGKGP